MADQKPPFRADHVGSLLRPEALLAARERWKRDEMTLDALHAKEDEDIKAVVRLQEDVGLQSITEFRRETFHADFLSKIEGIESDFDFKKAVKIGEDAAEGQTKQAPYVPIIADRMRRPAGGIEVANFKYLASLTDRTPKVTVPSPTMTHFRARPIPRWRISSPTSRGSIARSSPILARPAAATSSSTTPTSPICATSRCARARGRAARTRRSCRAPTPR